MDRRGKAPAHSSTGMPEHATISRTVQHKSTRNLPALDVYRLTAFQALLLLGLGRVQHCGAGGTHELQPFAVRREQ